MNMTLKSLMMHRLRSILSTLGILIGVAAVIAMLAIGEGAKQETLEQIEQLGTQSIIVRALEMTDEQQREAMQKKSLGLTEADAVAIKNTISAIDAYALLKQVDGETSSSDIAISEVVAVTPDLEKIKNLSLFAGRNFCDGDRRSRQLVCVLGKEFSDALGHNGHIGNTIRIHNETFEIIGILQPKSYSAKQSNLMASRNFNRAILIPLGSEQILLKKNKIRPMAVDELLIKLGAGSDIAKIAPLLRSILHFEHHGVEDYEVIIPQELLEQAIKTQSTFNLVLGSIAGLSLLVGGIGIMNIMLASVSERTREIGIRRALGATKANIIYQFLQETLALSLLGAILGILLGLLIAKLIIIFAGWQTIVTFWSVAISLSMASLAGIFSGLYPAFKAANMDPIEALRQ